MEQKLEEHLWIVPQEHDHALGIVIGAKRRGRRQSKQEALSREQLDHSTLILHTIDGASTLCQTLWKQRDSAEEWGECGPCSQTARVWIPTWGDTQPGGPV